jgi:hypothetical protein
MSNDKQAIGKFKPGDNLSARRFEQVRDGVRSVPLVRQAGTLTSHYPNGQRSKQLMTPSTAGSSLYYFEITSATNDNEYKAKRFDNPTDRTELASNVTIYAKRHTNGEIPNSAAGAGHWCIKVNDKYYIVSYSVFEG